MSFNKAAHVAMGEPEAIELLYDVKEKIVGVRGVPREAEHAYPLRSAPRSDGPFVVSGTAFTKYYGIDTTVSRRWVGVMNDGVLCIDLNTEGTIVTSNRSGTHVRNEDDAGQAG